MGAAFSTCAGFLEKGDSRGEEAARTMTKSAWQPIITDCSKQAGTYRPYFDNVIETLAAILEQRDAAVAQFEAEGREILVEHTNKAGATNVEQNPILRLINDLNRDALAYWRDLGLTPAGLKRIDEQSMKQRRKSALSEALKGLGG